MEVNSSVDAIMWSVHLIAANPARCGASSRRRLHE